MSSRTDRLQRERAKTAARLARQGLTHRQIADVVGIEVAKVASRIKLGERLLSVESGEVRT